MQSSVRGAAGRAVRRAGRILARARAGLAEAGSRCGTRINRWVQTLAERWGVVTARPEAGMATAEYAIATLAAVAFAGLLLVIMRSDEVRGLLTGIVREALSR